MGLFSDPAVAARLAAIERKLDAVIRELGIELPKEDFEDVRALKRGGNVIGAIKLYRAQTGTGLAEAKAFVDLIQ